MTIDGNSWHCRVYQWWYGNKYNFPANRYSNLCPYMRAVMFWAPLRAIFGTWITFGEVPLNAITIPATLYAVPMLLGYWSYSLKSFFFLFYLCIIVDIFGAVVIVGLAYLLLPSELDITKYLRQLFADSEFRGLLREYLRSAHDRVCPEVNWGGK